MGPLTLAQLEQTSPKAAAAYKLVVLQRKSTRSVARRLHVSRDIVTTRVLQARIKLGLHKPAEGHARDQVVEAHERRLASLGRCPRCELLLPCVCLPRSAAALAELRSGDGDVYPEAIA